MQLGRVGEEAVGQRLQGTRLQGEVKGVQLGRVGEEAVGQRLQGRGRQGEVLQLGRMGEKMAGPRDTGATGTQQIQPFQAGQSREATSGSGVRVRHDDLRFLQAGQAGQIVAFPQPQVIVHRGRQAGQGRQIGPGHSRTSAGSALCSQGGQKRGLDIGTARANRWRPRPRKDVPLRADISQICVDPQCVRVASGSRDSKPSVIRTASLYA